MSDAVDEVNGRMLVFLQSALAVVVIGFFLAACWGICLAPLSIARRAMRPIGAALAHHGLEADGGISFPRLRLWRGIHNDRAVLARLWLRSRGGPAILESALTICLAADVNAAWVANAHHPCPHSELQKSIAALSQATGLRGWEVRVVPGWVCIGLDTLVEVRRLNIDQIGALLSALHGLAEAVEASSNEGEPAMRSWRPEGWAAPAWMVWGTVLFLPVIMTVTAVPILACSIGLTIWGNL